MKHKIDILFIHPNASKIIYQDLSKDHSAIEPPIWAGMLANSVRSKNFSTNILDCEVLRLDYNQSVNEIMIDVILSTENTSYRVLIGIVFWWRQ